MKYPPINKVGKTLHWIVNVLETNKIPFRISGGVAARIYGSRRRIFDIDIDIPDSAFPVLKKRLKKYITFGPGSFRDMHWHLKMMTVRYNSVSIDLSGVKSGQLLDSSSGEWVRYGNDFRKSVNKRILGLTAPVIRKKSLIDYKRKLQRPADISDVKKLTGRK